MKCPVCEAPCVLLDDIVCTGCYCRVVACCCRRIGRWWPPWWVGVGWILGGLLLLVGSFTFAIPRPGLTVLGRGFDLVMIAAGLAVLFRRLRRAV